MLKVSYWMDHRAPNGGARENTQGAKGICNPIGGTTIWTTQYPPELLSLAAYVSEDGLVGHHWEETPWSRKLYMRKYRGGPGPRSGSGWVGEQGKGEGTGNFRDSIWNVNKETNKKKWKNYKMDRKYKLIIAYASMACLTNKPYHSQWGGLWLNLLK